MRRIFTILFCLFFLSVSAQKKTAKKNAAKKPSLGIVVPYREGKLWGFCDTLGNVKVKPIYSKVTPEYFFYGKQKALFIVKKNAKQFVINAEGKIFLPEANTYDSIKFISSNEYFAVYKNRKQGLFGKGKEVVAPSYDSAEPAENGSFYVKKDGLKGVVNSVGKLIVPIEYETVYASWKDEDQSNSKFVWLASGMIVEKKFYDKRLPEPSADDSPTMDVKIMSSELEERKENFEFASQYDTVELDERHNRIYVTKNGRKGIVDYENRVIIAVKYDDLKYMGKNKGVDFFRVSTDGQFGLLDTNSKMLLPIAYDEIKYDEVTHQYLLSKNGKFGLYMSNTIYPIIEPNYLKFKDSETIYVNNRWNFGLFWVETENGQGYVGENGVEYFKN